MCCLCLLLVFPACSHKEEVEAQVPYDSRVQGRVCFELVRKNVYLLSSLSQAKTIKVTMVSMDGDTLTLPSLPLEGTEDLIRTPYYPVKAGEYFVIGYKCFDLQADLIEDLDISIDEDNYVEVVAGEDLNLSLPTEVKRVLTTSNLYNTLYGICLEILGDNTDLWPKSWDFESGEISIDWAGLEFDTDANSNPTDVIGLVIDGTPQYVINSDTQEEQLVSLVEFRDMKVLPACVSNLTALQSIVVRNCALEELPAELAYSFINSLSVENTNLASLPSELGTMSALTSVEFRGNQMTEFPTCLTDVRTMEIFSLDNERISSIPESIANWGDHLVALDICRTDIEAVPDVFDRLFRVSTLNLSGNKRLSTLPPTLGFYKIPYDEGHTTNSAISGVLLDGCSFVSIPEQLQREGIRNLSMANNKLTTVDGTALQKMTDLEVLVLDGNKLSSFPRLTNPKLVMLSLIGTGLTREQVDLTGLPNLNPNYVFFTQEDYNKTFGY